MARQEWGSRKEAFLFHAALLLAAPRPARATAQPFDAGEGDGHAPWTARIRLAEEALARNEAVVAERAWRSAYFAALRNPWRWDGLVEAGYAALRLGDATESRRVAQARARRAFVAALLRAAQQRSLDGVLRAAEGFGAVGARDAADQCLRIAERLAAADAAARDRVRAFRERAAGSGRPGPELPRGETGARASALSAGGR